MAQHVIGDMIRETTTTTGQGTVTLAGAVTGYRSFADVGNGKQTFYRIDDNAGNWEVGIGTYTSSGTTLSRDTVLWTSAGNTTKISFAAGTKNVDCVAPAKYGSPLISVSSTTKAIQVADDTALSSTAGNARGTGAVDLQTKRDQNYKVAAGNYSGVLSGQNNSATNAGAVVCGGRGNRAAYLATCVGGLTNDANVAYAFVGGGVSNVVLGSTGAIGGGKNNYIPTGANYSCVPGGLYGKASKYGQLAYASGRFTATGDAQSSQYVLRCKPTNGTATELFLDGSSSRLVLSNDTSWGFSIQVIARRTDADGSNAYWNLSGAIKRDTNAASTTLIGSVISLVNQTDIGAISWTFAVTADTTNGSLKLAFTGEAGKTVQVVAFVTTTETTG